MPSIVVHFDFERETKNGIVRFKERGEKDTWKMGRVYIKPDDLVSIGSPKSVTLTITKCKP